MKRFTLAALTALTACASPAGNSPADTGDAPAPPGALTLSDTTLDLGELGVGDTVDTTLTITNAGEGPLAIHDIGLMDDQTAPHWTIAGGTSGDLLPGAELKLTIYAHPRTVGDTASALGVWSDDPTTPAASVTLLASGAGTPSARLEPSDLVDMGTAAVGESTEASVLIANDGSAPVTIAAASLTADADDSPFSLAVDPTGVALPAWSEDGLARVRFTPTTGGTIYGTLTITLDEPDSPELTVQLIATGTAADTGL